MSKKKNNTFPRTQPNPAVEVEDEVNTAPVITGNVATSEEGDKSQFLSEVGGAEGELAEEGDKPMLEQLGGVVEASMEEALMQEGEAGKVLKQEDNTLFESVELGDDVALPIHLRMIKEYLVEMRPKYPQTHMGDWQNRLNQALITLLNLAPQHAVPQMRVVISWLREDPNNAFAPAYRGRHLEALKLKGHKLREYESLLHAIYVISTCETKDDFTRQIDWESLRMQFTPKNSETYTRVLLGVCGY